MSDLKTMFEDYLYASSNFEKISKISMLIEEIFKNGFDPLALEFFSNHYDVHLKQQVVNEIFKELTHADEMRKFEIIDTLSSFLIETTLLIQDQILPIYIKNLSNKKDFKLVFTTLKVFTSKWEEFDDSLKKRLFNEFLIILDNPFDLFIEEGIYEITKLILTSKISSDITQRLFEDKEIKDYLQKLIHIAIKSKNESLNAALDSIKQIIVEIPVYISEDIYGSIYPLFKKFIRKVAVFYPAKRKFIKISLSFLELMLVFEKDYCDDNYIRYLKLLLEKMSGKIDHADLKYFLELISTILKNTVNLPKIEVVEPTLDLLSDANQKRERFDGYLKDLIAEIINHIWPLMSDDQKDIFFQEKDITDSVI